VKLKTETVNWFREMWIMVAVGVAEAALLMMAVPHLFNNWGELGRVIAVTALFKFFLYIKQSPLPRPQSVQVTMSGADATLSIEQPRGDNGVPKK
jgi:hypothetical protein